MRRNRRNECGKKYRWPTMEEAKRECWRKWRRGIWLQAYRCRWCGGIHIGHFRQDELPSVEIVMSKTRIYSVVCVYERNGKRYASVEGPRFLSQREAEDFLNYLRTAQVMYSDDVPEDEYAEMAVFEMQELARSRRRNPDDDGPPPPGPGCVRWEPPPPMTWYPCVEPPDGLERVKNRKR
jgi:hypothetical protein